MKAIKEINGEKVLIDTNILINCGRNEFGAGFRTVLRTLADNKNELAISTVSGFEIIKKYVGEKTVVDYYIKLLNYIPTIVVDIETMNIAGIIANKLYTNRDEYKKDNDYIIGATTIKDKGLLLTCDRSDFSKPFWDIVARDCVEWEDDKGCRKVENVFLLRPSYDKWIEKHKIDFSKVK